MAMEWRQRNRTRDVEPQHLIPLPRFLCQTLRNTPGACIAGPDCSARLPAPIRRHDFARGQNAHLRPWVRPVFG